MENISVIDLPAYALAANDFLIAKIVNNTVRTKNCIKLFKLTHTLHDLS